MSTVHDLHNFTINIAGNNAQFFPTLIQRLRGSFGIHYFTFCLAPFIKSLFCNFKGNFVKIPIKDFTILLNRSGNTQMRCHGQKFVRVFDLIIFGLFSGHRQKDLRHGSSVI